MISFFKEGHLKNQYHGIVKGFEKNGHLLQVEGLNL